MNKTQTLQKDSRMCMNHLHVVCQQKFSIWLLARTLIRIEVTFVKHCASIDDSRRTFWWFLYELNWVRCDVSIYYHEENKYSNFSFRSIHLPKNHETYCSILFFMCTILLTDLKKSFVIRMLRSSFKWMRSFPKAFSHKYTQTMYVKCVFGGDM